LPPTKDAVKRVNPMLRNVKIKPFKGLFVPKLILVLLLRVARKEGNSKGAE
jgi:hypothetical protein